MTACYNHPERPAAVELSWPEDGIAICADCIVSELRLLEAQKVNSNPPGWLGEPVLHIRTARIYERCGVCGDEVPSGGDDAGYHQPCVTCGKTTCVAGDCGGFEADGKYQTFHVECGLPEDRLCQRCGNYRESLLPSGGDERVCDDCRDHETITGERIHPSSMTYYRPEE